MNHILIVDDDAGVVGALQLLLKTEGYAVTSADSPDSALALLKATNFNLILLDLNYTKDTTSGNEGIELITFIRKVDENIPIVVMTGWASIEIAVNAMKSAANDFIQKPWENERLLTIINAQIKLFDSQKLSQKLQEKNQLLIQQVNADQCNDFVANSIEMQKVMSMIDQVAKTDVNILLTGENGTGKSVFARYIHNSSLRNAHDITSVNMGAISESLFESEMFGHVKGAFTDARSTRIGRFELAEGGTLFLDEIANTPYSQQVKLLRVLEERQFEKVGSSKTQNANVRLICATNADLDKAVIDGSFRKDLLFRINTIEIKIPALRTRKEDIIPLANCFLQKAVAKNTQKPLSLSPKAEASLLQYDWPGNIRELSHVMERAQILCQGDCVTSNDLGLPVAVIHSNRNKDCNEYPNDATLDEIEQIIIDRRLTYFDGNALKTAKSLGLSRSAFYRRLEKFE